MQPITPPDAGELQSLLGPGPWAAWQQATGFIEANYEMETLWFPGRKEHAYEFKYRRGGKTLCALYPRQGAFGFLLILGAAERQKFEARAAEFSPATLEVYHGTRTYHDGLWLMLEVRDGSFQADIEKLLPLKRRPNRK